MENLIRRQTQATTIVHMKKEPQPDRRKHGSATFMYIPSIMGNCESKALSGVKVCGRMCPDCFRPQPQPLGSLGTPLRQRLMTSGKHKYRGCHQICNIETQLGKPN